MSFGRWIISKADKPAIEALSKELSISELTAAVLVARGHGTPELARDFLENDSLLESPMAILDMDKAAMRINEAIENEERIAIFGDYDVDGITSTALMWMYLQGRGADVVCSLPTRESSGYGLSKDAVDNLNAYDVTLIITVDNGVSSYNEVAHAKTLGIDVIVCDHHVPPAQLPDAVAVVDPLRLDDESRFKELAGVGVALKLAAAVEGCEVDELLDVFGYLVAIGTISDIMPLRGENRTIVKTGLAQLRECDNLGLIALCEASDVDMQSITASTIGFGLAPRLNAAGRMDNADIALCLLITDDMEEAETIAQQLVELNVLRRDTEAEIVKRVNLELKQDPAILRQPIIVVAAENLHAGVTGIVCSRLVERYGKPVVIISIEGDDAKGSGRSVAGFSLHEAVASCASLLIKYGGHDMAAGFTINTQDIETLKQELFAYCRSLPEGVPCPTFGIDALIDIRAVSESVVEELETLAPFGSANEEPVFAVKNAEIIDIVPLNQSHSRITVRQNDATLSGAVFGKTPAMLPFQQSDFVDAAFMLSIYHGTTRSMLSVRFRDVRATGIDDSSFDSLQAYNNISAQRVLTDGERKLIAPSREEVALVYRAIKKQPIDRTDMAALSHQYPALPIGKTLTVLDILAQLDFVQDCAGEDGSYLTMANINPTKNELTNSSLYQTLNEEIPHDIPATHTTN